MTCYSYCLEQQSRPTNVKNRAQAVFPLFPNAGCHVSFLWRELMVNCLKRFYCNQSALVFDCTSRKAAADGNLLLHESVIK